MGSLNIPPRGSNDKVLELLEALRLEQATTNRGLRMIYALIDDFARVFLSSKFRYGQPDDRFARRSRRG